MMDGISKMAGYAAAKLPYRAEKLNGGVAVKRVVVCNPDPDVW